MHFAFASHRKAKTIIYRWYYIRTRLRHGKAIATTLEFGWNVSAHVVLQNLCTFVGLTAKNAILLRSICNCHFRSCIHTNWCPMIKRSCLIWRFVFVSFHSENSKRLEMAQNMDLYLKKKSRSNSICSIYIGKSLIRRGEPIKVTLDHVIFTFPWNSITNND